MKASASPLINVNAGISKSVLPIKRSDSSNGIFMPTIQSRPHPRKRPALRQRPILSPTSQELPFLGRAIGYVPTMKLKGSMAATTSSCESPFTRKELPVKKGPSLRSRGGFRLKRRPAAKPILDNININGDLFLSDPSSEAAINEKVHLLTLKSPPHTPSSAVFLPVM